MEFSTEHQEKLLEVLEWRRDVRHFWTDPVPDAVWDQVKAAVDYAPSVGNAQPWRMIEVQSLNLRQALIDHFTAENEVASQRYEGSERAQYINLKLAGLREAPIHVAVFTDLAPAAGRGLGRQTMPETLHYSTVTAIHTLWLAARAHNLGVGWVSIVDPAAVERLFNVPNDWALTGYLCIGKAKAPDKIPELEVRSWQKRNQTQWMVK